MSLLVDMMTNTLDESYGEAAARRAGASGGTAGGSAPESSGQALGRRAVAVALLVAAGLVAGTAAAQVRSRQAASNGVRAELVREVHRRTTSSDALAAQAARLRRDVAREQGAALQSGTTGAAMVRQLTALELATGLTAVRGPGIVVRLDDAPHANQTGSDRGGQASAGRVLDRDLQDVVNALWAAGAEAVAVNGLRLTALTAIRSAGEAILVDYRPLSPPYTVRAVGDPAALEPGYADSAAGRRLATYTSLYGLSITVSRSAGQTLPAAGSPALRLAKPVAAAR